MIHALVALAVLGGPPSTPTSADIVTRGLHDLSLTAKNVLGRQSELSKINKDFGESYRFRSMDVYAKEPFKLRLESRVNDTSVLYILNGTTRIYSIPRLRIRQKENVGEGPGKRQTFLDFGLVTRSLIDDLFDARFVRIDRATSDYVFDLTYDRRFKDTSRQRVWVDRTRRYVTKREWYNQQGKQMATFLYENAKEVDGIWVPTKATVKNVDDRVAGITEYSAIKVNKGLSDSLFEIN